MLQRCSKEFLLVILICIFFFSFYFRYIYSYTLGLVTIIDIYCTYFLYILMYVSFTYLYICCFFSLFIHMLLITCMQSIISVSHKHALMSLFKVFQKYRLSKSSCHKLSSSKIFQEFVLG